MPLRENSSRQPSVSIERKGKPGSPEFARFSDKVQKGVGEKVRQVLDGPGRYALIQTVATLTGRRKNMTPDTLQYLAEDPDVAVAVEALYRLVINLGISVSDVVPILFGGEALSWGADGAKIVKTFLAWFKVNVPIDPTPDVAVGWALIPEIPDALLAGILPTHLVETFLQGKADLPRVILGWRKIRDALRSPGVSPAALDAFS